ncbi:hypothetical protein CHRY9390_01890 [Chryseobacterium aquaeductus]|uniref:DUF6705 domain-containing protein n=2 Tax=Chryseobacterium aquaeductus TaxID=2675056 RepID=A0A9N8MHB6_9FLAO|nr:hypothetical protein CHRY9390_01890 [Chryseobacterium potabilaquae]CAD7808796.1 hypothetical protein CHRY9390_01890 [Chryseobacterium aquaeductus]
MNKLSIFFTAFLLNIAVIINAQTVVDISSSTPLPSDYNENGLYYEKDIHNYLDNFVGVWEYVNGKEKFQITLTKIVKHHLYSPKVKLNVYEDGIAFQYKKYKGSLLIYSSPIMSKPTFRTYDGNKLDGTFIDYERVTQEVRWPHYVGPPMAGTIYKQGGEYFHPDCTIEKVSSGLVSQIKFHLYLWPMNAGFGSPYDNPIYAGQPRFSIPNDVILTKVP